MRAQYPDITAVQQETQPFRRSGLCQWIACGIVVVRVQRLKWGSYALCLDVGCVGKRVSSKKVRLFQKKVLKNIVLCFKNLVFKNLVFKILVFGDGLQVCEVLRLKSSSIVIRLTEIFLQCCGRALHNYLIHNALRHLVLVMLINKISDFAANLMHIVFS